MSQSLSSAIIEGKQLQTISKQISVAICQENLFIKTGVLGTSLLTPWVIWRLISVENDLVWFFSDIETFSKELAPRE